MEWRGHLCVAMAVGAPLGVMLNSEFGISGFATVVVLVALIGLLFARTRRMSASPPVSGRRSTWWYAKSGLMVWSGPGVRGYRDLYHALFFRTSLARRGIYPFAVQRRVYLCSRWRVI